MPSVALVAAGVAGEGEAGNASTIECNGCNY